MTTDPPTADKTKNRARSFIDTDTPGRVVITDEGGVDNAQKTGRWIASTDTVDCEAHR